MAQLSLPIREMNSFDLPPVCLITGTRDGVTFRKVKFSWYPRWIVALILVPYGGLLLALILSLVMRKNATGELPFSEQGWSKHQLGRALNYVAIAVLLLGIFGVVFAFGAGGETVGAISLLATLGIVVFAIVYGGRIRVDPTRITDEEITLKIPSAAASGAIEAHLHSGRRAPPVRAVAV